MAAKERTRQLDELCEHATQHLPLKTFQYLTMSQTPAIHPCFAHHGRSWDEGEDFLPRTSHPSKISTNPEWSVDTPYPTKEVVVHDLRFPEDGAKTWSMMLYWAYYGELPDMEEADREKVHFVIMLAQCWLLGQKHAIPGFQDVITAKLLYVAKRRDLPASAIKLAFKAALHLDTGNGKELMAELEGHAGPKDVFLDIMRKYVSGDYADSNARVENREVWEFFMVAGGPPQRWVHSMDDAVEE